jgi:hypothetical protein
MNISKSFTFIAIFIVLTLCSYDAVTQPVYMPTTHEVYKFLKRMEAKGRIEGYRDAVLPLSRERIADFLLKLDNVSFEMTDLELEMFDFLKMEFAFEMSHSKDVVVPPDFRWHLISVGGDTNKIFVDPLFRLDWMKDQDKDVSLRAQGIKLYGYAYNTVGFYFNFVDHREAGNGINFGKLYSSEQGIVPTIVSSTSVEYDKIDAQLAIKIGSVELSLEKMENVWGLGNRGTLIFSRKSPSYPQIKLRVPFTDWMDFTYIHAELHSNIVDDVRSYQETFSSQPNFFRTVYRYKYMAAHMLEMTPIKGIDLSIGESVVYSDRIPQILYLIPVMFFKAAEHYERDLDNCQFFGALDFNLIPSINCYSTLFIDEININAIFDEKLQRNQLGFTVGIQTFDLGVNNLECILEYTRVNPWVYSHKYKAADFSNNGYDMGHWIGQNADNLYAEFSYRPMRQLKFGAFYEGFRKGGFDAVTAQYELPSRPFLYGPVRKEFSVGGYLSYQFVRDGFLYAQAKNHRLTDEANPATNYGNRTEFYLSLSYGIW